MAEAGPVAATPGVPDVVAIFPPDQGELDLVDFPPVKCAQADLANLRASSKEEVNVVIDDEVDDQVVELLGTHANLGFAMQDMDLPYLVFHIKNLNRYLRLELMVVDSKGTLYTILASNNQAGVRARSHSCSVPLRLSAGWNRVCLDLRKICERGFGVTYKCTAGVRLFANCRIWRLFFQDADYADNELPQHLRVLET